MSLCVQRKTRCEQQQSTKTNKNQQQQSTKINTKNSSTKNNNNPQDKQVSTTGKDIRPRNRLESFKASCDQGTQTAVLRRHNPYGCLPGVAQQFVHPPHLAVVAPRCSVGQHMATSSSRDLHAVARDSVGVDRFLSCPPPGARNGAVDDLEGPSRGQMVGRPICTDSSCAADRSHVVRSPPRCLHSSGCVDHRQGAPDRPQGDPHPAATLSPTHGSSSADGMADSLAGLGHGLPAPLRHQRGPRLSDSHLHLDQNGPSAAVTAGPQGGDLAPGAAPATATRQDIDSASVREEGLRRSDQAIKAVASRPYLEAVLHGPRTTCKAAAPLHPTFNQTGGSIAADGSDRQRSAGPGSGAPIAEASATGHPGGLRAPGGGREGQRLPPRDSGATAVATVHAAIADMQRFVDVWDESANTDARYGLTRRNRCSMLPQGVQNAWPLHSKAVPTLDLPALLASMPEDRRSRVQTLLSSFVPASRSGRRALKVPDKDLAVLLRHGILSPVKEIPDSAIVSDTEYFSVVETAKQRRRPIFWPRAAADVSNYESRFSTAKIAEMRSLALGKYGVTFDLASSFWQVPLADHVYMLLEDVHGNLYRITRMPFGIDFAPEVAQLLCEHLVRLALQQVPVETAAALRCVVHIDNTVAVSDDVKHVKFFESAYTAVCSSFRVTLNEHSAPSARFVFCGIDFDLAAHTVRPLKTPSLGAVTDLQSAEKEFGRAFWGSAVAGLQIARYFFAVKWWRRKLSQLARGAAQWSSKFDPPPSVRTQIALWWPEIVKASKVESPASADSSMHCIIAVDATPEGWGAVLLRADDVPHVVGARFAVPPSSINVAEKLAVFGRFSLCP